MTTDFAALDLSVACEKPFEFEITHPESRKGLGVFVSVIGSESETFRTYIREKANAAQLAGFAKQRRGKRDEPMSVEEQEEAVIDAIATCMTGWRTETDGKSEPVIVWGKDKLEFSKPNACKWLQAFPWVRAQVNDATADLGNFIEA
jgi:hypothetical protein